MKKKFKQILIFLFIYILCFLYSFFISTLYNDEIWNYGFSYNIASGLVPYRDFNMIVTPLYNFCASMFIKVFGSYLWSLHLFNSIVLASIIYISYRKLGSKCLILIPFVFLNCYPGYNIFSVLIILIIINLLDKDFKYKDYVLGLLVGIMFLTKQTIGICLFIPLMYYSKDKLKALIGMGSPIIIFLIYLIWNSALYEFIDYCFLGIFDFGESNSVWLFLPVEVIICLIILYKLVKSHFKNKELFYLLMYQIVTFPIFDDYHFMIGFIPVLYYVLLVSKIERYKIKYYVVIVLSFFVMWNFKMHQFEKINIYGDSNSYLYGRNIPGYVDLEDITNYIDVNRDKYNHIFMFSRNAYYVKMDAKYPIDKYDMINDGNMGYNGSEKYIQEIDDYCKSNSCLFILYKYEFNSEITQTNRKIVDFVIDNYKLKEEVDWFNIYSNEVEY